jgi:hypothetical protein
MAASTDSVAELLRAQGLRMTPQRLAIMGELMNADDAMVASALAARVRDKLPGVTVARCTGRSTTSNASACSCMSTWHRGWRIGASTSRNTPT